MAGKIYLVHENNHLTPMQEQPYATEAMLQELLERYPDLLAGEQMRPDSPPRWLLVKREMGVADCEDSGDRWSLDHLFLDDRGVPTLIEVKRSTDTRIRRKVVGQMLDYAANAVVYWPLEKIRAEFERTCEVAGDDPSEVLRQFLEDENDESETQTAGSFWESVGTNLAAERIRIVFVADEIPTELRRIIEFLNGQMDPAEVFGVEVRHFAAGALRTLVPTVVGQTAKAQAKAQAKGQKKRSGGPTGDGWDESSFLDEIAAQAGDGARRVAGRLMDWIKRSQSISGSYFIHSDEGKFQPYLSLDAHKSFIPFRINVAGHLTIPFRMSRTRKPFDQPDKLREWLNRINKLPQCAFPASLIVSGAPEIKLDWLDDPAAFDRFIAIVEWTLSEARRAWNV